MPDGQRESPETSGEQASNSPETIPGESIYAYNMDETKTSGGLKVRWKVRVITGPAAARWDTRQNAAIMELLQWASRHHPHPR
jgi:hypothetical protein